jgi:hypothetical protein
MKKEVLDELTKVANETKILDAHMSEDLSKLAQDLAMVLSDDELDTIVEKSSSIDKEAKLINEGDTVVCVDNFSPLYKGRRYVVSDASIPGFLVIREEDGSDVGVFAVNRFSIDWANY